MDHLGIVFATKRVLRRHPGFVTKANLSSVGILSKIPFDATRIDCGLVQKAEEIGSDRYTVQNMVEPANVFGARVRVVGVETEGMRDIPFGRNIDSRDVDGLQGRCHARPAVRTDCRPSTTGCADLHGADSPAKGYAAVTVRARPKGRARHRVTREAVPPIAVTRPRV